jgi:hypothetical protein
VNQPLTHAIETGWGDDFDGMAQMKAYCRNCQTWFSAFCSDPTDYLTIRRAEQEARKPFEDYACFDAGISQTA